MVYRRRVSGFFSFLVPVIGTSADVVECALTCWTYYSRATPAHCPCLIHNSLSVTDGADQEVAGVNVKLTDLSNHSTKKYSGVE